MPLVDIIGILDRADTLTSKVTKDVKMKQATIEHRALIDSDVIAVWTLGGPNPLSSSLTLSC